MFPAGLKADMDYHVSFQNKKEVWIASGADLTANGIRLENIADGELVAYPLTVEQRFQNWLAQQAQEQLLPGFPPAARTFAENYLREQGVTIVAGQRITAVGEDSAQVPSSWRVTSPGSSTAS